MNNKFLDLDSGTSKIEFYSKLSSFASITDSILSRKPVHIFAILLFHTSKRRFYNTFNGTKLQVKP